MTYTQDWTWRTDLSSFAVMKGPGDLILQLSLALFSLVVRFELALQVPAQDLLLDESRLFSCECLAEVERVGLEVVEDC